MDTNDIDKYLAANVQRYEQKHGLTFDDEFLSLKLVEEVGEFAQALLIYKNKCRVDKRKDEVLAKQELSEELADVLGMSLALAQELDIDVWKALDEKWLARGRKHIDG